MVMSCNETEADHPRGELSNDADHRAKCQIWDPKNVEQGANDHDPEEKRQHFSQWDLSNDQEEKHPEGSYVSQWKAEQVMVKQVKHFGW